MAERYAMNEVTFRVIADPEKYEKEAALYDALFDDAVKKARLLFEQAIGKGIKLEVS